MEEPNEEHRVVPELYFLIAKFLSGGPLKETAKTLLKELESIEVLPRRLDWEGTEHTQSYEELDSQYSDVSFNRLAKVCEQALQLARRAPGDNGVQQGLSARLSLLSETLVRPKPQYASYKQDHTLVRRIANRELGIGPAAVPGGPAGQAMFPSRMLGSLNLQRRTLGHLSAVYCVVFDCSGRYVITGADDMLVKIWSAVDGRLLCTLRGVGAEVTDVCVSADGALVACGSVDKLVRVWCLRSAEPRAVLQAHAGTITSVHWAPPARKDVRWLASTSTDCSVAFWTCSPDGHFLSQPVQYVERMRPGVCHMICAAWSAGGAFLAAGSADHHVRVYTVEHEPGGPKRVLETAVHDDAVDSISWAHRGLRFVSGSKDGSAALWTLHATQWRHHLLQPVGTNTDGKRLKMTMVCWDSSDAYVMTAVSDNTIRVWCSRTWTQVRCLSGHRDEAYVLEAHPFLAGVFLSAGHDGQLLVWDVQGQAEGEGPLARFHNRIDGHGDGAIFDAKWGGPATIAATDSHGHLLLLGLGAGHRLYGALPTELFFHTDYRPVVLDALGGAHDEQTDTPPHLLPPPFLVDVEGAPHAPPYQRTVPGRENLALSQLIPVADAPRSQINSLIEALAIGAGGPFAGAGYRGVWRGEGVRYTAGTWERGDPILVPQCSRPVVPPLAPAVSARLHEASRELNALEQAWYRREMRRRPLMISTATEGQGGARRRAGRRPRPAARPTTRPAPRPAPPQRVSSPEPESASQASSASSDEWLQTPRPRLTRPPLASRSSADTRASLSELDLELDDTTSSHSCSRSGSSSSSSQYSDWEGGAAAALAPPARARRRPLRPTKRYSPSQVATKRAERQVPAAHAQSPSPEAATPAHAPPAAALVPESIPGGSELPDAYRPGEWITAVSPRKAPYHPQMGDQCLYFRLGHQRYFEAVSEKDVYKVNPRDKPWERTHVYECELVKVVGIKYVIKPPRVVCLRLACSLAAPGVAGVAASRSVTVRYHDMPDVIDFLVLKQQYDVAVARRWGAGDRFRCMIDDCWWTGEVLERAGDPGAGSSDSAPGGGGGAPGAEAEAEAEAWVQAAAAHFLALKVRWDNGEVERLSPWDLEPLDTSRLPSQPGGAVPVLPAELDAVLYRAEPSEWDGDRPVASRAIAHHIGAVMSLSVAEPFIAPVDLALYPAYARVVPYPVDLATIRSRCEHLFYRRAAAAQFDARYLASNAERFNDPHAPIVRQARLVTDLLLYIISGWRSCDVLAKYHELADNYRSSPSDDEPLRRAKSHGDSSWRATCAGVLAELTASADSEPFRTPVSREQAPDYTLVVSRPMDLGAVRERLSRGLYPAPEQFAGDVRQVFANSRLYNTNKRSRIYSMTVRLSALFEALWSRHSTRTRAPGPAAGPRGPRPSRVARRPRRVVRHVALCESSDSSADESPLAAVRLRDSCDSDAPLTAHRDKGKGVGKKSKGSSTSASASVEPGPSTSSQPYTAHTDEPDPYERLNGKRSTWERDGHSTSRTTERDGNSTSRTTERDGNSTYRTRERDRHSARGRDRDDSSSSRSHSTQCSNIEVLEEHLHDEVELTYSDSDQRRRSQGSTRRSRGVHARKRKRLRSATSGSGSGGGWRRHRHNKPKRTRERFTQGSSSSSSSTSGSAGSDARRYESDRSYRPRYSTDDDRPLHLYRSGTAASAHHSPASASGGVSLRARRSQRRYNEDSEEDSVAAISKRLQHHARPQSHHQHVASRRRRHAAQSASAAGAGVSVASSSAMSAAGEALRADHAYFGEPPHHRHNGAGSSAEGSTSAPVSISSRGRVRKLTPKAQGLLRD